MPAPVTTAPVGAEPPPLAVFDIDGVLADVRHRLPLLSRRPKDWAGFFAAAPADPAFAQGLALVRESARDCEVAYLTGRPESCRADTLAWLARHDLPVHTLLMRGAADRRPARLVKPELLRELGRGRTVAVVVDDDPQVCDAYERGGWPVLRASWAVSLPALREAQQAEGRT